MFFYGFPLSSSRMSTEKKCSFVWFLGGDWLVRVVDTTGYWRALVGEMLGDARRRCVQITTPVRRLGGVVGCFFWGGLLSRIIP